MYCIFLRNCYPHERHLPLSPASRRVHMLHPRSECFLKGPNIVVGVQNLKLSERARPQYWTRPQSFDVRSTSVPGSISSLCVLMKELNCDPSIVKSQSWGCEMTADSPTPEELWQEWWWPLNGLKKGEVKGPAAGQYLVHMRRLLYQSILHVWRLPPSLLLFLLLTDDLIWCRICTFSDLLGCFLPLFVSLTLLIRHRCTQSPQGFDLPHAANPFFNHPFRVFSNTEEKLDRTT